MDVSGLVRAARRRTGLSQRAFAERCGVSARQLAAIEGGTADPRHSTVARLVAGAELELGLVPAVVGGDPGLRRYLRESTSDRLAWSFTGLRLVVRSADPRWRAMVALSRQGHLRLDGRAALGLWLPVRVGPDPLAVVLHRTGPDGPADEDPRAQGQQGDCSPGLLVTVTQEPPPAGDVAVAIGAPRQRVHVPPPLLLAAHPECEEHASRLRAAASLLHDEAARDEQGRRGPVHRDAWEEREHEDVIHRREHRDRQLPSALDSRSWRLGQAVSLQRWLGEHPYPRW